MKRIFTLLVLLAALSDTVKAQDSTTITKKLPERRNELGVSVTVPLIIALGTSNFDERFTNVSYRHFISQKLAIKPFVGISTINNGYEYPRIISSANTSTVYFMRQASTPSNFQLGVGYEYIMGRRKLRHVIGADIVYNNKFLKEKYSYYKETDSTDADGHVNRYTTPIDSGAYVVTSNYDKIGFNLSYSLRYEASKRWVITASTVMTNRFYWQKSQNKRTQNYDLNFVGLISDISIFYRF